VLSKALGVLEMRGGALGASNNNKGLNQKGKS
jgi:hypothetical protein